MKWSSLSLAVMSLAAACALGRGLDAQDKPLCGIEPHAETQRLLADFFDPTPQRDLAVELKKLEDLLALAKEDGPRFVRQGVLGEVQHGYGIDLGLLWLFKKAGLTHDDFLLGVSTLLYCEDARVREAAWELFPHTYKCGCVNGHPDLAAYRNHVTGSDQESSVAEPLKRAIFEKFPNAAFRLFVESEAERDDLLPYRKLERAIDNACYEKKYLGGLPDGMIDAKTAAAIRELADSNYWWSRMFAAEIMVQHKEFRDETLIEKLLKDDEPLVRQSVASIKTPDPLRASPVDK